jgi:predicted lysophospholipase L1 biosynthesis ABC-type transport system permease subunit
MSAPVAPRRGARPRWSTELALGARLSVGGGRSGWARLAMISIGVGLGVAMLLIAATIPALVAARDARLVGRAPDVSGSLPRGADTLLTVEVNTRYRDYPMYGRLIQPEGDRAPLPPGVTRRLAAGEMVVSPAMARLLATDEGALLRGRWGARVVGTIGAHGLSGPGEYAFYLGTDRLIEDSASRIRSFGRTDLDEGVPPTLLLLGAVALVALLLPVMVFLATAVRFGGEARDRQLAALRLVGADAAMTRRIAAAETLVGALLGLVAGGLLYLAAALLAGGLVPADLSFYPADLRPVPALAALVVVLVPVTAVLVTMSALRRVVVEPLGVVRLSADHRRRLWWRLILPAVGLALLYPLHSGLSSRATGFEYQVMAGMAFLLVGVALLLPWLVAATVRRLGGGSVAWQLAVRRLQLDSGTAVRAVSGIAVSVAGAIALQGLLAAVQAQYTHETERGTDQFQIVVLPRLEWFEPDGSSMATLRKAPEVRALSAVTLVRATSTQPTAQPSEVMLKVGDCDVLRQFARLDACADGDTFVVADRHAAPPSPGSAFALGDPAGRESDPVPQWTLPATARTVPGTDTDQLQTGTTVLVTPGALHGSRPDPTAVDLYVGLDRSDPDALDQLRNTVARLDPTANVMLIQPRTIEAVMLNIRRGLLVAAVALLMLIGASMLVNVIEQLRERRRLLAVLAAFGTRRATLSGSVLYQVAIPVLLGLTLAVATGTGLSMVLQAAANAPIRFDWPGIGATSGAAALVVLATTTASLPLLWRLTRPSGLRTE